MSRAQEHQHHQMTSIYHGMMRRQTTDDDNDDALVLSCSWYTERSQTPKSYQISDVSRLDDICFHISSPQLYLYRATYTARNQMHILIVGQEWTSWPKIKIIPLLVELNPLVILRCHIHLQNWTIPNSYG